MMAPMTRTFVQVIEAFVKREGVDLIAFKSGERKDSRTQEYSCNWPGNAGVLYVGKARVMRTQAYTDPATG